MLPKDQKKITWGNSGKQQMEVVRHLQRRKLAREEPLKPGEDLADQNRHGGE